MNFILKGSALDIDNTVFENNLCNADCIRGLTITATFCDSFISLRLTLDPSSVGTLDLSGLNFDPNSSFIRVVDANQPSNPQAPLCDVYLCVGEHITFHARDLTVGSPVGGV
jgi:hypothetical protein